MKKSLPEIVAVLAAIFSSGCYGRHNPSDWYLSAYRDGKYGSGDNTVAVTDWHDPVERDVHLGRRGVVTNRASLPTTCP
jgi:hypothetical protein